MISKGLFTQVLVVLLAAGIIIFYIRPAFSDVTQMQDDIVLYQEERQKVDAVNAQLDALASQLNSVSAEDQRRLITYIPDQVDPLAVSRILQKIAEEADVLFSDVAYGEIVDTYIQEAEENGITDYPVPHEFSINVQGTYIQIKNLLELLERNEYPLEVHEMDINVLEGDFLDVSLVLVTYSHELPQPSGFNN